MAHVWMRSGLPLLVGLLGLPLLPLLPAQAADPAPPAAEAAVEAAPYEEDRFQIQLPPDWSMEATAEVTRIVSSDDFAPTIDTTVEWQPIPPGELVPPALDAMTERGDAVLRYRPTLIDGVTALQIWIGELPEPRPYALITYVGYEEATAVITSRYAVLNETTDRLLVDLHSSFSANGD